MLLSTASDFSMRGVCILHIDPETVQLIGARITDSHVVALLADGREIATPLEWYPLLHNAPPTAREHFEMSPFGIHWPDLDEDLGIEGMLAGTRAPAR